MAETVRQRMVKQYAYAIYIDGTRTFTSIAASYHEEIKQYAAVNFTDVQIQNALNMGYITQVEYDQTMVYKTPTAP